MHACTSWHLCNACTCAACELCASDTSALCCCVALCDYPGPFISYVELSELQQVEQQLQELHAAQNQSTAGTNPTTTSIDWSSVGGKSLHDQQDVWGNQARARHTQQS